ncbi:MAG: hypothetical protein L0H84_08840 [Pseudonocardia sp.]|nr:hypothetical protein [Pseudonocardia sp.]
MTKKYRPRHAAPTKVGRIAGRVAAGAIGAPLAMFAAAGPAGAVPLAEDGAGGEAEFSASFEPGSFDAASLDAVPGGLPGAPAIPDLPGPATVEALLAQLTAANPLPATVSPSAVDAEHAWAAFGEEWDDWSASAADAAAHSGDCSDGASGDSAAEDAESGDEGSGDEGSGDENAEFSGGSDVSGGTGDSDVSSGSDASGGSDVSGDSGGSDVSGGANADSAASNAGSGSGGGLVGDLLAPLF